MIENDNLPCSMIMANKTANGLEKYYSAVDADCGVATCRTIEESCGIFSFFHNNTNVSYTNNFRTLKRD